MVFGLTIALGTAAIGSALPAIAAAQIELSAHADASAEDLEPLTSGPIHEAFASPTTLDAEAGLVIGKEPPADIDEVPPAYVPEGDDIIWVPGYWAWDDERSDFFWISGVWRERPVGQRWVPGYWNPVEGGFQWVSGFWISADVSELSYQPEPPPESLETGPSSPAPANNYFWIPGCWNYYDTGYRWRTGYWAPYQTNWIWTPARWCWTPRGYVFSGGYWDYRFANRGQLFAPVYYRHPIYQRPGYFYTPHIGINAGNLFVSLWIRPNYNHYYYGNYYGSRYDRWNMVPWWRAGASGRIYDPLFAYSRVHYGLQGINYTDRIRGWHDYYDRHEDRRPSRTWSEQVRRSQRDDDRIQQNQIGERLEDLADRTDSRLRRINEEQRRNYVSLSREIKDLHRERLQVERTAGSLAGRTDRDGKGDRGGKNDPADADRREDRGDRATLKLPKSTVATHRRSEGRGGPRDSVAPPPEPMGSETARDDAGRDRDPGRNGKGRTDRSDDSPAARDTARDGGDKGRDKADSAKGRTVDAPKGRDDDRAKGRTVDNAKGRDSTGSKGRDADTVKGRSIDRTPDVTPDTTPGSAFNEERGPTLDRRLQEARDRAKAASEGKSTSKADRPSTDSPKRGDSPKRSDKTNRGDFSDRGDVPKLDRPSSAAPKLNTPRDLPKTDRSDRSDRSERAGSGLPTRTPRTEASPRIESSPRIDSTPRPEPPRPETSRPDRQPRTEARRVEIPNADASRSSPRINLPTPRVETSRPEPRHEVSRPQPRVETSRPQPRIEASRPEPRAESPRPQPRVEASRPQPRSESRSSESSNRSSASSSRSNGSSSRSNGSSGRDKGNSGSNRGRDHD